CEPLRNSGLAPDDCITNASICEHLLCFFCPYYRTMAFHAAHGLPWSCFLGFSTHLMSGCVWDFRMLFSAIHGCGMLREFRIRTDGPPAIPKGLASALRFARPSRPWPKLSQGRGVVGVTLPNQSRKPDWDESGRSVEFTEVADGYPARGAVGRSGEYENGTGGRHFGG